MSTREVKEDPVVFEYDGHGRCYGATKASVTIGEDEDGTPIRRKRAYKFPVIRPEDLAEGVWDWYVAHFPTVEDATNTLFRGSRYFIGSNTGNDLRKSLVAPSTSAIVKMLKDRALKSFMTGDAETGNAIMAAAETAVDRDAAVGLWEKYIQSETVAALKLNR